MSYSALRQLLLLHPASFRTLYVDRQINNIYLDTPELTTWNDNIFGVNQRKKYRIRWYGNDMNHLQNPRLELKIKHNELGKKEAFPLDDFSLEDLAEILQRLAQKRPEFPDLRPSLLNTYQRSYLRSFDGRFRLTIDRNMCFYPLRGMTIFPEQAVFDNALILEVKYEREDDNLVEQITQHLPFRQSRHSKYVQGVRLIS